MGPGILPETTVSKHNLPCHLQMPTKAISCKKKAICEHGPEAPLCPVGHGSFKILKWLEAFLLEFTDAVSRPFHTEREKAKRISDAMTFEHSRTENANVFFTPVRRIFSISQSENTGRPIRFELGSRDRSSYCCTKGWEWLRCFENQGKQMPKKSILDKRREWMLSSCYRWYLRTDFSHVLYTE